MIEGMIIGAAIMLLLVVCAHVGGFVSPQAIEEKPKDAKGATRLTVEYSDQTANRLKEMQDTVGLKSPVDVIRLSIRVLSYLMKEQKAGWEIVLRKGEQEKALKAKGEG